MSIRIGSNIVANTIAIDDELSSSSKNAVENKVIKTALDNKLDSNKIWSGTKAEYDELLENEQIDADTLYNITDDQTASAYEAYTKAEADSTFADVDLANLSNTGQKVLDGQWVISGIAIASSATAPTSTSDEYSLATYLPNDGYDYEVMFTVGATTGTTSGNQIYIALQTDIQTYAMPVCRTQTRSSNSVVDAGSIILPVGTDRTVSVYNFSSNTGTYNLNARAYRRIGTNS